MVAQIVLFLAPLPSSTRTWLRRFRSSNCSDACAFLSASSSLPSSSLCASARPSASFSSRFSSNNDASRASAAVAMACRRATAPHGAYGKRSRSSARGCVGSQREPALVPGITKDG
eukprot:349926-Chlamydomonas_euryale.AAC.4